MSKKFTKNERRISQLFKEVKEVTYKGDRYRVLYVAKPEWKGRGGEPKTDIYICMESVEGRNIQNLKISYKQDNADFIENKITSERAEQILGKNWRSIISSLTLSIKDNFEKRKLIFVDKYQHTNAGSITLGWRFELTRVVNGELSKKIDLTPQQVKDVYTGMNLPTEKKDASVNGVIIKDSGVANYMLEEDTSKLFGSAQEVIDNLKTIDEYLVDYPDLYYACKALNYQLHSKKIEGNRSLSVYVDWTVKDGKLESNLIFDKPLTVKGNEVRNGLETALNECKIKSTKDISNSVIQDPIKIFRK